MNDESTQVNTRTANSIANKNITTIDSIIIKHVETNLTDLDADIDELSSVMETLKDKTMQSNEIGFPISLARFAEIRLATRKQKNELLKTLITYKSNEQSNRKRSSDATSSIQDILAGVGLGAAMTTSKINISGATCNTCKEIEVERTDIVDADIELEYSNPNSMLPSVLREL